LIAGVAIGLMIPRAADMTSSVSDATGGLDRISSRLHYRNVYYPDIRHDGYVRQEQLRTVELLEQQCRLTRENCKLAKASRAALTND
jgi:hypothetical protein